MAIKDKQALAAKKFVKEWSGKGYEKGETQRFWLSLLHNVFGIDDPTMVMRFELPVKTFTKDKGADFIDAYITTTKVLIEQKGSHVNLADKEKQSDGMMLTPYQQALRYLTGLPTSMAPRWIVTCNFKEFRIHDMEHPNLEPQIVLLEDLEKEYYRLEFLVNDEAEARKKEFEVSIKAGEIVGILYEKILAQYRDPDNVESQKSLNKLCVRLVFCLYAEDAGIFGRKDMFHDYLKQFPANQMRRALIDLFEVLNTPMDKRDPYMDESLAQFPYANGGLFGGDSIEIPQFTEELKDLLLEKASYDFDWSEISPTIFGAVFESTLNPETRRAGGMHYTSIENIHKVIDPLFLDDLKEELASIKAVKAFKDRKAKAVAFQDKIAGLKFFDPACGSGNFLTETYTSLRRLENDAIRIIYGGDRVMGAIADPIKVSINQFYGIEINDFACSVAQTALWIAESQMMQETDEIVGYDLDPLPLKTYNNIHEGNALRMDWNEVIPARELNYIMGNPPFLGARVMSAEQKDDLISVFGAKWKNIGNMDYVTGWYKKSLEMMQGNNAIRAALVSTNSITQGEQVANLWKPLMDAGIHIDFAWRTFIWDSEASQKAHVHCVIVGFSLCHSGRMRRIFDGKEFFEVSNINGYLIDGGNVFIDSRSSTLSDVPAIGIGNMPIDGGAYLFKDEEKEEFVKKEPGADKYFRRWYGSDEFINRRPRWCLWLGEADPVELLKLPECIKRIESVRDFRASSTRPATKKLADTPTRFGTENIPTSNYLLIPKVSSERRQYIPVGFMEPGDLSSDLVFIIPYATLYHFGVLTSSIHNAWMRAVAGRLKSDYRYSKDIVYNNFPWPLPTNTQEKKIEQSAQAILDAREKYPEASFADMYGNLILFPELMKAHRANDAAVLEAYGFPKDASESDIVARLFKMYQELTAKE